MEERLFHDAPFYTAEYPPRYPLPPPEGFHELWVGGDAPSPATLAPATAVSLRVRPRGPALTTPLSIPSLMSLALPYLLMKRQTLAGAVTGGLAFSFTRGLNSLKAYPDSLSRP